MTILTFDIEDWFNTHQNRRHYSGQIWDDLPPKIEENTERILDFLERHDKKATFFILGWIAKKYPLLIKKIYNKGHEIGSHSFWHHNPHFISHDDFEKDTKLSLDVLQDITGEKVVAYRAPGFNLDLNDTWAFEILAENGITIDSSVELRKSPKNIPLNVNTSKYGILEFPLVKSHYGFPYSGGGYFRVLPESLLKHFFKLNDYNLLYFHPRDFDPKVPSINLFSFFRNALNSYNTVNCMRKLEKVLKDYKTLTLNEAVNYYSKKVK